MSLEPTQFDNHVPPAWCPGCGNFGILTAVKKALAEMELPPSQVLICSGIGQGPKLPHYLKVNCFDGLHGREVAAATAAKLVAPELTILVHAGDGGAYGEGGNHLLHAIRRNIDLTLVVHDNHIYGLTKGQASPTTEAGLKLKIHPRGVTARPMNPLALAISQSCGLVAQSMSARTDHLADTLIKAVRHRGFSLVNVLQPCVTWDKLHTYEYYQERCFELGADWEPTDRLQALKLVLAEEGRIALGVIYIDARPAYDEVVLKALPRPLRTKPVEPEKAAALFERFI